MKKYEDDNMSIILVMFIALFCVLTILSVGYLLIRKINDSEQSIYSKIVLQCTNPECKSNNSKEFRYNVHKDRLKEILPCPLCNKTRQLLETK